MDGDIGDCACSIESVDFFNNQQVFPIIDQLMLRNYFRYYKVLALISYYKVLLTVSHGCHTTGCFFILIYLLCKVVTFKLLDIKQ